ncbi:hypothetical protein [Methylovulum psychrotolerans]|uniref:Uncharacterized protein n=1 Tax=Methylovulum psychrotolerans TaxID=1704499 RepID=A0A1Z4BY02_9GAMM|nr:hypothetical protein [Methylovulum psychrotolerans]ASF46177.1 hypothetical protein CEK71_08830 [Methylovulum psychrotolerans]
MNTSILTKTLASSLLLGFCLYTPASFAVNLNGALGSAAGAIDFYRVTCASNTNGVTDNLKVTVRNLAPVTSPLMSVQVIKGILAKNTTDAVNADTTLSPAAIVKGGNGVYDVRVNKAGAGAENYALTYACLNSAGKATGVAIATAQNQ